MPSRSPRNKSWVGSQPTASDGLSHNRDFQSPKDSSGFQPEVVNSVAQDRSLEPYSAVRSQSKLLNFLVARDGIEPPTPAFSGLRSTN